MRMPRLLAPALVLALASMAAPGQTSVPPNQVSPFKDTSTFKPPAGARVAVIEYEDLECPSCARAFPMVHAAVKHYNIPLEEYDYQIPFHHWSHEAAIFSHYLKAKVSPQVAEEFRRETFAKQLSIASRDDLQRWEQQFMKEQNKPMPFVVDPTGEYDREVGATTAQGQKAGVNATPTILVVTPTHWIQVADPQDMYAAIDQAEAEAGRSAPVTAHRTGTARK